MKRYILITILLVVLQAAGLDSQKHDFFFFPLLNAGSTSQGVTYTLYFKYAARYGRPLRYTEFKIFWNQFQKGFIRPEDYQVHHQWYNLQVKPNTAYTLKFVGIGGAQAFGSTIDQIMITGSDGTQLTINNWNFEDIDTSKGPVKGQISGWTGKAQVGNGFQYNPMWCCGNKVVILDPSAGAAQISQVFETDANGKFKQLDTNQENYH